MGAIIPPGFAQVLHRIRMSTATSDYLVTYGVSVETPGSQAMVNALHSAFSDTWDDFMPTGYTIPGAILRVGQDGTDPVTFESNNAAGTGAGGAGVFPPNTAMLVQKRTGLGGRRNRGRMYIPAVVPEAGADNAGLIDPTYLAGRQTAATAFLAAVAAVSGVGTMVVLHSEAPSTPAGVTSLVVDPRLATQRRRLRH